MCPGRKLNAIRKEAREWVRQDCLRRRRERVQAAHRRAELAAEVAEARRLRRQHERTFEKVGVLHNSYQLILTVCLL